MGPLAGVGDTLIWTLLPTILGSIAGYMALEGNPVGTILWLLTNVVFIIIRTQLMWIGYKEGTKLITKFGAKIAQITDAASVLGLDCYRLPGCHRRNRRHSPYIPDGRSQHGSI